eukprot:5027170-Amphidinium_carterae.1
MKTKYEMWRVDLLDVYAVGMSTCGIASATMAEAVLMAIMTHEKYTSSEKKSKLEASWSRQIPSDTQTSGYDIKSAVHPGIKDA